MQIQSFLAGVPYIVIGFRYCLYLFSYFLLFHPWMDGCKRITRSFSIFVVFLYIIHVDWSSLLQGWQWPTCPYRAIKNQRYNAQSKDEKLLAGSLLSTFKRMAISSSLFCVFCGLYNPMVKVSNIYYICHPTFCHIVFENGTDWGTCYLYPNETTIVSNGLATQCCFPSSLTEIIYVVKSPSMTNQDISLAVQVLVPLKCGKYSGLSIVCV